MGRLRWMGMVLAGTLPMAAGAQTPFNIDADAKPEAAVVLGGTPAVDIISLRAIGPGAPLRYGNVVPSSESVQLDSRKLVRNQDYAMDYAAGVVFLKVAQRAGQSLTVSYRYTASAGTVVQQASPFAGIGGFRYQVAPESLSLIMGMGVAERAADGSVLQSNVFGFNNSFKFGSSQVTGVYLYGDRIKSGNQAGLNFDPKAKGGDASTEEGKSQLILQGATTKVLGGEVGFDYQDVDKNFANFASAKQAGLDDATLTRLQNEKGMTRFGMAMKDVKLGSMALSQNYRTIEDSAGGISWRSMGMKQGGLQVNWSSQKVDKGFTRFKDIAEADREQLMREVGMSRESRGIQFADKAAKIGFNSTAIWDDATGSNIRREEYTLDTSRVKFNLGKQEVDEGFAKMPNLKGDEQAMYGREVGIRRQWMGLQAALFGGKSAVPLTFNQSLLKGSEGEFRARDIAAAGKGWTLQVAERKVDQKFSRMNAMGDGEMDTHVKAIAQMYGPNVPTRPEDRARFLNSQGITRDYSRLGLQPFRNWTVDFSKLDLKGKDGGGQVTTASVSSPNATLNYRKQHLGAKFTELTALMDFERQRLGEIVGLERTDLGMNMRLGGKRSLNVSKMAASTTEGSVNRTNVAYTDRKIDVSVSTREVSSGFSNANQLVDAEKDLLASMRGFDQKEAKIKWAILPGVNLDAAMFDAENATDDEFRRMRALNLDWTPNKTTNFQYQSFEQKSSDPLSTLFANRVERMMMTKDFGRFGKLKFQDERQSYDGEQANQPDMHRQYLSFETKLDAKTSVRAERTRTRFDNGEKEDVSANTVSTELNKRMGVAVTDVAVDRKGDERDEKKRNYGFWFDLGRGLMLSYGYARHLNGEDGTLTSSVSLGTAKDPVAPDKVGSAGTGNLGGLNVGAAYGANEWDDANRTQAFSNINLKNAKPFRLGFIRDLNFNFGLDTAADQGKWLRENRQFGLAGKIGANSFGFDYKGQMHESGYRAIDRTYRISTDPSEKSWLRSTVMYKVRTLPWNEQVMIRDYNVTAKVTKNSELTHQLQTNPEVFKGDALLGSVTQAAKSSKWKFDLKNSANLTVSAVWEELVNEQAGHLARTGGMSLKMFEKSGSPLTLYYGVEQARRPDFKRTTHRYHLQFDQKQGANQNFSLFLGNVSYEHSIEDQFKRNNWSMRLDYQLRF
ncbi:MAG: hypothetical protein ACO1SV_23105 [Fimbriimonas sp.]